MRLRPQDQCSLAAACSTLPLTRFLCFFIRGYYDGPGPDEREFYHRHPYERDGPYERCADCLRCIGCCRMPWLPLCALPLLVSANTASAAAGALPHLTVLPTECAACILPFPASAVARRMGADLTGKSGSGSLESTLRGGAAPRRRQPDRLAPPARAALQTLMVCARRRRRRRHAGGSSGQRVQRQQGRVQEAPAWSALAACRAAHPQLSRATPPSPPAGTPRWALPCLAASPAAWQMQQSSTSGSWMAQLQRCWNSRQRCLRPRSRCPTRSTSSSRLAFSSASSRQQPR